MENNVEDILQSTEHSGGKKFAQKQDQCEIRTKVQNPELYRIRVKRNNIA